jgi:transcription elongation factor GreA
MATQVTYLTEEGFARAKAELEQLRSVDRPAASRAIAEARDKGDLSENAEYDAAKEAQGLLEMRISQMEAMLASARLIDRSKVGTDTVQILNRVRLKNHGTGKEVAYTLVPEQEANFKEGKLATTTPIAAALLGHKRGDVVTVSVPAGTMTLEILEISI